MCDITVCMCVSWWVVRAADTETYPNVLAHFHTIWIKARPDEHMARVRAQGDERPMAGNPEAMEQLRSILTSREALYGRALAQLDTSDQTVDQSLASLITMVQERGFTGCSGLHPQACLISGRATNHRRRQRFAARRSAPPCPVPPPACRYAALTS